MTNAETRMTKAVQDHVTDSLLCLYLKLPNNNEGLNASSVVDYLSRTPKHHAFIRRFFDVLLHIQKQLDTKKIDSVIYKNRFEYLRSLLIHIGKMWSEDEGEVQPFTEMEIFHQRNCDRFFQNRIFQDLESHKQYVDAEWVVREIRSITGQVPQSCWGD